MNHSIIRILSLLAGMLAVCCILSGVTACNQDTILQACARSLQAETLRTDDTQPGAQGGTPGAYATAHNSVSKMGLLPALPSIWSPPFACLCGAACPSLLQRTVGSLNPKCVGALPQNGPAGGRQHGATAQLRADIRQTPR